MSLSTEYPLWFILFCLLLAAGGSWLLYRNNKLDLSGRYGRLVQGALMLFRFLSIFIIAFLLLGPLLKMISRKVEKPFIIFALDNSESITASKDSAFYRREFPALIEQVRKELQDDYEVKTYTFGKEVKTEQNLGFSEKQTDISKVFDEVGSNYSNQNLGAVILASDGLYNEGNNPLYSSRALHAPVFSIALGDTTQRKDLLIKNVKHNQLVYQGNMFPMQVDVQAFGCQAQQATLTVSHKGQTVFTKSISIGGSSFFTGIPLELEARESGMQHYTITLSRLSGEVSYVNNHADVFINVINGKQKVLLLALAPHPDLTAYKQAIGSSENYEVVLKSFNDFDARQAGDYNLAILHQLPGPNGEGVAIIQQLKDRRVPLLYVLGGQTGINMLNRVQGTLAISGNRDNTTDVLPALNSEFSLFTLSEEEIDAVKKFPPLQSPYGNYLVRGEAAVLMRQQVGYVKTNVPLIFFSRQGDSKAGFICGEGFWKWRLYDAGLSKQQVTQSLLGKIVQYLAARDDKSPFRITGRKRFYENEPVQFDAEVYNESYELINTPEVQVQIRNAAGKTFSYAFSRTDKAYTLDAGLMPVGNYTYEASVNNGAKVQRLKGSFTILPLQVEFLQTVADHQLLNQLSLQSGGQLFYPDQTEALIKALRDNEQIKPVIYKQEEVKSWINLRWIFFLLLGLLTAEWFVRKWNGSV